MLISPLTNFFSINFKFHTDVNRFFCRILFLSVYLSFFFVNFSLFVLCCKLIWIPSLHFLNARWMSYSVSFRNPVGYAAEVYYRRSKELRKTFIANECKKQRHNNIIFCSNISEKKFT